MPILPVRCRLSVLPLTGTHYYKETQKVLSVQEGQASEIDPFRMVVADLENGGLG